LFFWEINKIEAFRKADYKYTGEPETDKLIEEMPEKPENVDSVEVHYFRNKLNIEYSWEEFEKLNERLPEKYRWIKMGLLASWEHQKTADVGKWNSKFVSADGYFEAIYSFDNVLLNEKNAPEDMGTYNFNPSTDWESPLELGEAWAGHFRNDMLPYYILENTEEEKQEKQKRVMEDMKWR